MDVYLPIAVAAAAAGSIVLIAIGIASGRSTDPVQARLSQLGTMQAKSLAEIELQQPFLDRTLRPFANRLAAFPRRFTSATFAERTELRLAQAGNPSGIRVQEWLGIKVIAAAVAGLSFFLIFGLLLGMGAPAGLLFGIGGVVGGYIGPDYWLGRKIKGRQHLIVLGLPDALDLLTISVRAGLGFDAALGKVVERMRGPLPDEFRRALAEVRMGKLRRDALRDIIVRTDVPPLTNFISAVIQAEQLGVSISKVLQVQSEQLRIERRQRAEEMAQKAPIKLLFPLIGCIFPCLFIVLLGPAIITVILGLSGVTG